SRTTSSPTSAATPSWPPARCHASTPDWARPWTGASSSPTPPPPSSPSTCASTAGQPTPSNGPRRTDRRRCPPGSAAGGSSTSTSRPGPGSTPAPPPRGAARCAAPPSAPHRVRGPRSVPALRAALVDLVARHASLRTVFDDVDGHPLQRITPVPEAADLLTEEDLSDRPAHERDRELARLLEAETQQPFDLARGPLFRALLVRMDAHEHVLVLSSHHIVS